MHVTKNQHVVSQAYLRRRAFQGEQVYVLDKTTSRVFPSTVQNVACERYVYDIPAQHLNPQADRQGVEKYLAKLDERFAQCRDLLLAQVDGQGRFDPELKQELADYVLLQLVRTKTHRQQFIDIGTMVHKVVGGNPY